MTMQVTQTTRTQAWNDFRRIECAVRYCDKMHQWYKRFYFYSSLVLGLLGASSIASFLAQVPDLYIGIINGIVAFIAIRNLIANDGQNIENMKQLQERLSGIHNEYRNLWLRMQNYQTDNDEVLLDLNKLNTDYSNANNDSGDLPRLLFLSNWCNTRAHKEAITVLTNQYIENATTT